MQGVIVAGGKGTRLKDRLGDLPKPMVEIGGKPLLEHQIASFKESGIDDLLVLTGCGAKHIEEYFGDGSRWGVQIRYRREREPLGTAGAVIEAFDALQPAFVLAYGDTMFNIDISRMISAHGPESAATLFLHPNSHPFDSDLVETNSEGQIIKFRSYPHPEGQFFGNLVNAALYVLNRGKLADWHRRKNQLSYPLDFGKHVFPAMLRSGATLQGYRSREYIKDAGTPKRLDEVTEDYESGRIESGSLWSAVPAVFFDRDGTLNYDCGWLKSPNQLALLPGAAEAVRRVNRAGYLAVIVTNQPVIARGECTEDGLALIHNKLEWELGKNHAYLDAIYACPHHPESGHRGEVRELKRVCECRKPGVELFRRAGQDLNIDLARSWMIGDRASDILAARNLGMSSVLVARNGEDSSAADSCEPTYRCLSVLGAVRYALSMET